MDLTSTARTRLLLVLFGGVQFFLLLNAGQTPAQLGDSPSSNGQRILDVAEHTDVATAAKITRRFEIYDPHTVEELKAVKEIGFTQVILDWPNLHTDATALGLDVVIPNWWVADTPRADIERGIKRASQVERGRLIGFSVMDDLYNELRPRFDRELPGVSIEISHWGPLHSWNEIDYTIFRPLYKAADVMRIMPYPDLFEGPLQDVYFTMRRSRKLMRMVGREMPLVVILQAWTLSPESELPTIDELRVMAYQAMLGGAETLSFYHYRPQEWDRTPGFHEAFAGLMKELTRLSDRYSDAAIQSKMTKNGVLEALITLSSGETTVIRVNTNRRSVDGLQPLEVEQPALAPVRRSTTILSTPPYCDRRRKLFRRQALRAR